MTTHELKAFDYVNRPYAAVKTLLTQDPVATFRRATLHEGADADAGLHAKVGPLLEVTSTIAIEVLGVEETSVVEGHPRTDIKIRWQATRKPGMFPTMNATLSVYPLSPTETQLELAGTYTPPMGAVGQVLDATAMRGIAEKSVEGLVKDLGSYLRRTMTDAA